MDTFPYIDSDALMRGSAYTGLFEAFWPNGKPRYQGQFVDGVEVGQHVRYWEDGTIAQVQWYDPEGNPRGTTVTFHSDGDKCSEETWDDPQRRRGTFVRRDYDANGDVFLRTVYREYEIIEDWQRPREPDPEFDAQIDKIVADAVRQTEEALQVTDEDEFEDEDDEKDEER